MAPRYCSGCGEVLMAPRYCSGCGAFMIQRSYADNFDTFSGKPHLHISYKCPNFRWWRMQNHNKYSECGGSPNRACTERSLNKMFMG